MAAPQRDLYVVFHVRSHEFFERDGDDIYCEMPVTFCPGALGDEIEVPTPHGKSEAEDSSRYTN